MRKRLLTTQNRQKTYADRRKRHLEFTMGDHVFLKVSPKRGIMHFGHNGKLSPMFIGPFEIFDRVRATVSSCFTTAVGECTQCVSCFDVAEV